VSDRALAVELDRALAGETAAEEARELAALLRAAAEPARFDVAAEEVEAALAGTRLAPRRRRPRRRAVALVAVAAAAAVAALLLRAPGTDVQARAARAVDATFFFVARVQAAQPRLFPATDVTGYVDGARGRAHVRVFSRVDGTVAETVLHSNGSVERWLARTNTTALAPTCDALPGGCGETFDPLGLYVRAVDGERATVRRVRGGYELRLRSGRVEQRVVVAARTYLPRRIEWRQDGRLVAVTTFLSLERQEAAPGPDFWRLSAHGGARVVQLTADGKRVRVRAVVPGRPAAATRWLGPSWNGVRARVDVVRLTGGSATRIRYGDLSVWNYGAVIPPQVLQATSLPAKIFTLPGGALVHAYYGNAGRQVAVVSYGDANVAVVSASGDNVDVVRAAQQLRRARGG
jgi:hypothetical protein